MNTRKGLPQFPLFSAHLCVYCGSIADSRDHTPSRCFLRPPLPSSIGLITLPACKKCNAQFSFDENVVRAIMSLISDQPDLAAERQPGGRTDRALARDARLRSIVEACRRADGMYELSGEVLAAFDRVFCKTVQGLFFGLYERLVTKDQLQVQLICDQRHDTPDDVVQQFRPPPLRDITDQPLGDLTPSSWMVREPVFIMQMQPLEGNGPSVQRLFHLVRETPVEWVRLQPDIFSFAFVKSESVGRAVCVLDLWETLIAAVAAPWPDARGPIRKGKKNPLSRERQNRMGR